MKKAMWAVDSTGEFRFSDEDNPAQLSMFSETFDDEWLASELSTRLAGRDHERRQGQGVRLNGDTLLLVQVGAEVT